MFTTITDIFCRARARLLHFSSLFRLLLSALTALALTACGGSNSSSGDFDSSVTASSIDGAPILTSVVMSSDASSDTLSMNQTITVTITANEPILAPSVSIAGDSADAVTGSGTEWTASRTMVVGDPDGAISLDIRFTDTSGETGVAVSNTTDNSAFSFQNPEPLQLNEALSDEFSGTSLDSSWAFQNGDGSDFGLPNGWGNNELQNYRPEQVAVVNGNLVITADIASDSSLSKIGNDGAQNVGPAYVSGRIRSTQVVDMSQAAGRVEVRAKVPEGQGIWPAIWMLPTQDVVDEFGVWPMTGEVDIMEATNLGVDGKQTIQSTIHYGFPFPNNRFNYVLYEPGVNPQDDFHIYAMEWETNAAEGTGEIRFYFDDVHFATNTSDNWFAVQQNDDGTFTELPGAAPFDKTFNVLINVAVGGNLGGNPDSTTVFPQTLEVDYLRVFDCSFPREDAPCSAGVNPDVSPVPGAGSVDTYELSIYDGVAVSAQTFNVNAVDYTNNMQVGAFNPNGEIQVSDFDATDPTGGDNSVWNWRVVGGVANTFIGSEDLTENEVLATGFDFTGADYSGSVIFDMYVDDISDDTQLLVKMDSGFPNVGQVVLSDLAIDQWKTYSVSIADLLANQLQCCDGTGLNLSNVLNLFVIEAGTTGEASAISVDVYLDNIRIVSACPSDSVCALNNKLKPVEGVVTVFDDALSPLWADGISAFDQALNFSSCSNNGGESCPSINWQVVAAADTERGNVLQVDYASDAQFAGMVIGSATSGLDLSPFATGELVFDLNVTANPNNANFIMKADCVTCPVNAGEREQNIGLPNADWQTYRIPVADLVNANGGPSAGGLQMNSVSTGLVIFPSFGNTAGVSYQIDDIRWEQGSDEVEPPVAESKGDIYIDALSSTWADGLAAFDQAIGFGSCNNDGGVGCPSIAWAEQAASDADRGMVIDVSYTGDAQFAGFIVGLSNAGVDLSDYANGDLVFDINVGANPADANFIVKVDCIGCPTDAGQREQNLGTPTLGQWVTYAVPVQDIINANGGPDAGGLAIDKTTTGLVIFPAFGSTAGVQYQIDNVRLSAASGQVFDDSVAPGWPAKVSAFDQAIGFNSCVDDGGAGCPSIAWQSVAATDRGNVIEVAYTGDAQFAGLIVGLNDAGADLSHYDNGKLVFDLNVTANPSNAAFSMKIDCVGCPVDAGQREQNIGVPASGWQTITVPIVDLIEASGGPGSGGLVSSAVTTGLVLFPAFGATAGVEYQIDNIRWEAN